MDLEIPDELMQSFLEEEGYTPYIYQDTAKKKHATSGMGHKLTKEEKDFYKIADYKRVNISKNATIKIYRQVAVDKKGEPIIVDSKVISTWQKEDVKKAYRHAKLNADHLGIESQDFINRLAHVNFQVGPSWFDGKNKFPTAWQALKDRDWEKAKENLQYADPNKSKAQKDTSDWYKTSSTRVVKFQEAIDRYSKLHDRQSMNPDNTLMDRALAEWQVPR